MSVPTCTSDEPQIDDIAMALAQNLLSVVEASTGNSETTCTLLKEREIINKKLDWANARAEELLNERKKLQQRLEETKKHFPTTRHGAPDQEDQIFNAAVVRVAEDDLLEQNDAVIELLDGIRRHRQRLFEVNDELGERFIQRMVETGRRP